MRELASLLTARQVRVEGFVAAVVCTAVTLIPAIAEVAAPGPNFSPNNITGWLARDDEFIQPPSGPGPVTFDPAYPYISFYKWPANPKPAFRVADLTNPILQPWTREELRKANEQALSGKVVSIL